MSKMYKDVCPCKGCKDRTIGCHSLCSLYNNWKSSGIEIKKEPSAPLIDFSKRQKRRW